MRVEYDKEADILYIKFKESRVADTRPVADDVYLDLDELGDPVGIEIWKASQNAIQPISRSIAESLKATLTH